ncbi:MAG: HAMP domain-containing protein [Deltaproteobacteria bacterium]|nr:HAMP domain-containing protein [Deltaproteobacteria bacterium]
MQEGAKIVGSGDLDYVVPVKHKDEIGYLTQDFNRMTASSDWWPPCSGIAGSLKRTTRDWP